MIIRMQIVAFCLAIAYIANAQAQSDEQIVRDLDIYIESARQQWEVPGLAVGIVKDGRVLLSKGYGVRSLESKAPVESSTIFSIGSTTKAMTAAAMAILVDDGHVKWTDKVIDHLPDFQLADPYVTRELLIKDLFTHNAGLGNADWLWAQWGHTKKDIVHRLRYLKPNYSFRGGYTYQNIMYATAGLLIEELSGMPWKTFVRTKLFEPLGMNNTFATKGEAYSYDNRSIPHHYVDGNVVTIEDSNADSIDAAGSGWSCTDDMVKWMNFVLDSAKIEGERIISKESFKELHRPHIVIPKDQFYPTAALTNPHFTTYALGWFQHDYQGHFVHFHTGSLNGTVAIIGLLPDRDIGVYVFGNLDHAEVRHAIMYRVFDAFLGNPIRDWSSDLKKLYGKRQENAKARIAKRNTSKKSDAPTSIPHEDLIGSFHHTMWGNIDIAPVGETIRLTFRNDRYMTLDHWHYDTYWGAFDQYPFSDGYLIDFYRVSDNSVRMKLWGIEFVKN